MIEITNAPEIAIGFLAPSLLKVSFFSFNTLRNRKMKRILAVFGAHIFRKRLQASTPLRRNPVRSKAIQDGNHFRSPLSAITAWPSTGTTCSRYFFKNILLFTHFWIFNKIWYSSDLSIRRWQCAELLEGVQVRKKWWPFENKKTNISPDDEPSCFVHAYKQRMPSNEYLE